MSNTIGTITLQNDVMWINRIYEPQFTENVGHTLGFGINIQRYPVGARIIQIGTVDADKGKPQGYFTYEQFLALQVYARASTEVTFSYEGDSVNVVILESSLGNLKPLINRPEPEATDWYMGTFTVVEI
jgi:hypothetical protein